LEIQWSLTPLIPPASAMRNYFMGWQCRLRQYAVRQEGGRPGAGMRPGVFLGNDESPLCRVTVLIVRRDSEPITAELRHLCKRTFDPADRYASAIQYLSAAYYQRPERFDDELTALFGHGSKIAAKLVGERWCRLDFEQYSQRFELACRVRALADSEPAFQATYWHNCLFNPAIPGNVSVIGFTPDWTTARADPPPGSMGSGINGVRTVNGVKLD
jgi:hypothetical protein